MSFIDKYFLSPSGKNFPFAIMNTSIFLYLSSISFILAGSFSHFNTFPTQNYANRFLTCVYQRIQPKNFFHSIEKRPPHGRSFHSTSLYHFEMLKSLHNQFPLLSWTIWHPMTFDTFIVVITLLKATRIFTLSNV